MFKVRATCNVKTVKARFSNVPVTCNVKTAEGGFCKEQGVSSMQSLTSNSYEICKALVMCVNSIKKILQGARHLQWISSNRRIPLSTSCIQCKTAEEEFRNVLPHAFSKEQGNASVV